MEKLAKIYFDLFELFDFVGLSKFFFENSIISYIVGILLIYIVFKLLKFPFKIFKKIVVNSVIGYVILYVLALFKVTIVPFTYLSYFLVGSFGTVGIILSYLFYRPFGMTAFQSYSLSISYTYSLHVPLLPSRVKWMTQKIL